MKLRSDLFYRLNVFPITIPPLRERRGDVPLLVRYFSKKHSMRMNKRIETVAKETLDALGRVNLTLAVVAINGWNRLNVAFKGREFITLAERGVTQVKRLFEKVLPPVSRRGGSQLFTAPQ